MDDLGSGLSHKAPAVAPKKAIVTLHFTVELVKLSGCTFVLLEQCSLV